MTNQEYILQSLSAFGVSPEQADFILMKAQINPGGDVDFSNTKALDAAIYYQVPLMAAGMADITEGGYSIKWNMEALRAWMKVLASSLGLSDPFAAKVVNKSYVW